MQIPNISQPVVPIQKVSGYLLSLVHPAGKSKAKFFISQGFSQENPGTLREALMQHAFQEIEETEATPYGTKYIIKAEMATPKGSSPMVVSVWICESPLNQPTFVTAYPA